MSLQAGNPLEIDISKRGWVATDTMKQQDLWATIFTQNGQGLGNFNFSRHARRDNDRLSLLSYVAEQGQVGNFE